MNRLGKLRPWLGNHLRAASRQLCNALCLDAAGPAGQAVLVAGTGRSGTTWIGDVVAKMIRARNIFEPFLMDRWRHYLLAGSAPHDLSTVDWGYSLYLPAATGPNNPYHAAIVRILAGKTINSWSGGAPNQVGVFRRRVIKEIRVNLLLDYLHARWPGLKTIWVVRNPFRVVESQLDCVIRRGWKFDWQPQQVLEQAALMRDWLHPFESSFAAAKDHAERLMQRWCIETYVPLQQQLATAGKVLLVHYEDLTKRLEPWQHIARWVSGVDWPAQELQKHLATNSFTTAPDPARRHESGNRFVHLAAEQRLALARIIDCYGLSQFTSTGESALPKAS